MNRLLGLTHFTALALVSTLAGCDAPEKSVGQETDGAQTSGAGSDSDTQNCGPGIAACTESDSDTIDPSGSESSGGAIDCESVLDPGDCENAGCVWRGSTLYPASGNICEQQDAEIGFCIAADDGSGNGCGLTPYCESGDFELYFRPNGGDAWELLRRYDCTHAIPDDFTSCTDSSAPEACDCECGTQAALPAGWDDELTAGGCADMTVYGDNADGSVGIAITTGPDFDPVAAAVAAGEVVTTMHDVSEFSRVSVYVGDNVLYPECNDALDKNAYEIQQEWVATAGTITIEIAPEMDPPRFDTQGYATITVTGLEVSYDGATESVDTFVLDNVAVGWLPG
jgi:hypothetical protein